jgi:hypothetical protein
VRDRCASIQWIGGVSREDSFGQFWRERFVTAHAAQQGVAADEPRRAAGKPSVAYARLAAERQCWLEEERTGKITGLSQSNRAVRANRPASRVDLEGGNVKEILGWVGTIGGGLIIWYGGQHLWSGTPGAAGYALDIALLPIGVAILFFSLRSFRKKSPGASS